MVAMEQLLYPLIGSLQSEVVKIYRKKSLYSKMHSYANSMSSSFLLFVLPRNEVLYPANNHFVSKWSIFQQKEKLKKALLPYYLFSSASSKTRQKKDKRNIKLVVILESPEFPKGPILTAIGFNSLMTLVK